MDSKKPAEPPSGRSDSEPAGGGKGSGKREFSRGGSIETAGFQGAERPPIGRSDREDYWWTPRRLSRLLFWLLTGITLGNLAGVFYGWYFTFPWFDGALHAAGGAWAALFALYLFQTGRFRKWDGWDRTRFQTFLAILSLVALAGVFWEFLEFGLDWYRGDSILNQPSVADTMADFFFGLVGGSAAMLIVRPERI